MKDWIYQLALQAIVSVTPPEPIPEEVSDAELIKVALYEGHCPDCQAPDPMMEHLGGFVFIAECHDCGAKFSVPVFVGRGLQVVRLN